MSFDDKKWYESKTFWAGILGILGGVLTTISGEITGGMTLTLSSVVFTILRAVTKSRITF